MTTFEKWKTRYENNGCTLQNLQDLFELGEITKDEFCQITGVQPTLPTLEVAIQQVLTLLKTYKWEKLEYIQYNGHLQRYGNEDKLLMLETQELLEKGLTQSVNWVHSDGVIVAVTDAQYIMNMRLTGGAFTEAGFSAELFIANIIKQLTTIEEVIAYDYKAAFDTKYAEELAKLQTV